ncbi:MAG: helix-turn-helix transcriptional regulator [Myxococcales bacterium]|nr:helix-turn-helix transcriptional regulator [Myxococcales bacterium]
MDRDEVHARVAQRIRDRAASRKVTLQDLATRAGTSKSYLFAVLRGTKSPTLSWMCRIADVLECDLHELVRPARKKTASPQRLPE